MIPSSCFIAADNTPFDNICDSGASRCAFYSTDFFTSTLITPPTTCLLGGIANGLPIQGIGTAIITLKTHKNRIIHLHTPHSLYVPDLTCNLLSPQWLIQSLQKQNKNSSFHIFPHGCLFLVDTHIIPLLYHSASNLPMFQLLPTNERIHWINPEHQNPKHDPSSLLLLHRFEASIPSEIPKLPPCQTPNEYDNLTATQKQLYDWHVQLGHMNYGTIQSMACKDMMTMATLMAHPTPPRHPPQATNTPTTPSTREVSRWHQTLKFGAHTTTTTTLRNSYVEVLPRLPYPFPMLLSSTSLSTMTSDTCHPSIQHLTWPLHKSGMIFELDLMISSLDSSNSATNMVL